MKSVDRKLTRDILGRVEIDGKTYEIKEPTLGQTLLRMKKYQEFNDYVDSVKDVSTENATAFSEYKIKEAQWMIEDLSIITGLEFSVIEKTTESMRNEIMEIVSGVKDEGKVEKKRKKGSRGGK
jgi:hypothetical protein